MHEWKDFVLCGIFRNDTLIHKETYVRMEIMNIIDFCWEYIINFLELMLYLIYIHTKLHAKSNMKYRMIVMTVLVTGQYLFLSICNTVGVSSYITLMISCILDIGYAVLFFQDAMILRLFWGFFFSIVCLIAEYITFFIPIMIYKNHSLELLSGGDLRKPYTMLYIAMIAALVFILHYIGNKKITMSIWQKIAYVLIAISGLMIGHYILQLTLEAIEFFPNQTFPSKLSFVNLLFVVLFLALLLYIYQLGYSKEENLRLLNEKKIYELERTEFYSLAKTTEALREMKHDMQIHLDAISVLAKEEKWKNLMEYIDQYSNNLAHTHSLVSTGNVAIDCILTSKIDDAARKGIWTGYAVITPADFPLDPISLASLLGNLWNNSIEAGERLQSLKTGETPYIHFYIKPFQNMILIHIENNYDGNLKQSANHIFLTTKSGVNHGIGLNRVTDIVEKAGGMIQITTDNHIFSVHIMIPDKRIAYENENNDS
jgi:hypothetical protein